LGTSSVPPPDALPSPTAARGRLIERRWVRVGFVVGLLLLAFLVSQSCQKSQIRITKESAIAKAEREVDFKPTNRQVRLLRQGLTSRPFWIVSLSVPRPEPEPNEPEFAELAVVRVDANTGNVTDVRIQR
jgi:hypothetical protein